MKIVFSSSVAWYVFNFRLDLLRSLQKDGHEIYTVATYDNYAKKLVACGITFITLKVNNIKTNPLQDILLILRYFKIYKSIKPDLICHNTIKPNIYGTIAARLLNIPVVNNISGLGTVFIKRSFLTIIAIQLYKFSQKFAKIVIFQNKHDQKLFNDMNIVSLNKTRVINGSGVDTSEFKNSHKFRPENFTFLFVGRLLKDKGILEFIEAAKRIKRQHPKVKFQVLGAFCPQNRSAIHMNQMNEWVADKVVDYLGFTDQVKTVMENANCLVLPSYREGLSKALIEGSSMSLPIITSDTPGCKDVIVDHETGFLCQIKDSNDLFLKMEKILRLSPDQLVNMGNAGRMRAESLFDVKDVISAYKSAIIST